MPPKPITHDRWLKGLQAGFDRMSQPKGSISRVSNLVYTRRGGLKTCDGSQIFSALGGMQPLVWDPARARVWREMVYYQPSTGLRTGYYGLYSDPGITSIGGPGQGSAATLTAVASPNGLTGTFYVRITAIDGVGGETSASAETSISLSNQGFNASWTPIPEAYGYNLYVGTAPGAEVLWLPPGMSASAVGPSVIGHDANGVPVGSTIQAPPPVDSTWVQNNAQLPPSADTSSGTTFIQIVPGGYSGANIIHVFPAMVSVISTGGQAVTATTSNPQGPPPVSTTLLRPTASVQGGPLGGSPNDFANPQFAQDGDPNTAAVASVPPGGQNGAQRTWTGFPAMPAGTTTLILNITSSMTVSNSAVRCFVQFAYSLNAGANWIYFVQHTDLGGYNQRTDSLSISPTDQGGQPANLANLRVTAYCSVPSTAASGVCSIWEIWMAATAPPPQPPTPGGPPTISTSATPNGGLEGICGPLPQMVTFRNNMILALGNGFPPYLSDGSPAGTVPIFNHFTAVYPMWASGVNYLVGDQIEGGGYVFTAVQGGTTGGGQPNWPPNLGQTVTDNNIIWKNSGQVTTSPPPRGAAHAEIYAGSLWVANTWPTVTPDQLDGPSALRMSILNDPDGWNPLNAAQISPDDSDECQGIKAFTIAEAGIAPQNFLMYFKYFSSYLIQGVFGASNFAITRLQTDMGCIASRTIQFVPGYGIMRLSHLGFAVTDGINDRLQDPETIRPYLFAESTESDITPLDWSQVWFSKASQTTNPPMYICAMPLVGANAFLIGQVNGVTVTVAVAAPSLPQGTYYVQVGLRGPAGVTSLSPVLGPFVVASGNVLNVSLPPVPQYFYGWRVWFGTDPNALSQFVDGNASSISINGPGEGGAPPKGIELSLTRLFCYDLVLKAWTVVDLPYSISAMKQFRVENIQPVTSLAGSYDTAIRRWQYGDPQWDLGAQATQNDLEVRAAFTDAEVHNQAATVRVFHNQVIVRGAGGPSSISVTPEVNGYLQGTVRAAMIALGNGQFEARARLLQAAENVALTVAWKGPAVVESVSYDVQPKPAGAALVFS